MKTHRRIRLMVSVVIGLFVMLGCSMNPPSFELKITPSTNTFSAAGEVITYTYKVRNLGGYSMLLGQIVDYKLGFCMGATQVGIGGEVTCEMSYTTTPEDVAAGVIKNSASAIGVTQDTGLGCRDSSQQVEETASAEVSFKLPAPPPPTPISVLPQLTVELSAAPTSYGKINDIIIYTYTVHNTGTAAIEGPFTLVDSKATQWECDDAGVAGYSLPSDGYIGCKGYYRIKQGDLCSQVTNTGHVEGIYIDDVVASNQVTTTVNYAGSCNKPEDSGPQMPIPTPPILIIPNR